MAVKVAVVVKVAPALPCSARLRSDVSQMLCAPRGLPLAELEKHIDGATLDLGRIAASWEKEGKKVSFENEGLQGYPTGFGSCLALFQ